MSHQPERKEKNCLNCDTVVAGRFCQHCGQANIDTRESFWSLTKHFVFDILHFDGQFFHTTRYLFARPGLVPRQYAEGKRARYLHPIRMYLFMSALFFLVFFSLDNSSERTRKPVTTEKRLRVAGRLREQLKEHPGDTLLQGRIARLTDTTLPVHTADLSSDDAVRSLYLNGARTFAEYDSMQQALPKDKRDGWLERRLNIRALEINREFDGRNEEVGPAVMEKFMHRLPYLFFFSLPFFALLLKLLYIRRRHFYYSDHATFTLYHYIMAFQVLLVAMLVNALQEWTGWDWLSFITGLLFLLGMVYLYLEMKNFYRQSRIKTLVKFLLLNLLGVVVVFLLFMVFLVFSVYQI